MKKALIIGLSLILICGLAACGKKKEEELPEVPSYSSFEEPGQLAGGWNINTENSLTSMPQDAASAWAGAMEGLTGASYEPVALIGTQVVAGTNFMFLARKTTVTAQPVTKLAAVKIYYNLEGKSEILSVKELDLGQLTSNPNSGTDPQAGLTGGFTVFEDMDKMADVSDDDKAIFEKALEGLTGVGYTPVTVLGTQVVAGQNIAFLAKGVMTTAEPVTNAYVISVYKNLESGAELNNICVLNLADLAE